MLDVGWTELVVIAIVLIIVVGPKDLPPMLRTFGKMMTKMRGMASDFRQQFDEALKEADLDDVRRTLSDAQKLNPAHSLREAMNPLRQMGNDIKADLQKAASVETKPVESAVPAPVKMPAEVTVPEEQPKANPVATAGLASPAKQPDRAEAIAALVEEPKAKRVSKPKAAAVGAAVATPAKSTAKKVKAEAATVVQPESAKAAPKKRKKKGDA